MHNVVATVPHTLLTLIYARDSVCTRAYIHLRVRDLVGSAVVASRVSPGYQGGAMAPSVKSEKYLKGKNVLATTLSRGIGSCDMI